VLGFVGVKMLLEAVDVKVPIWLSLVVIIGALGVTTVLSLKTETPEQKEEAKKKSADKKEQTAS
jgi:predicted tellurium resistance membrane protein TerC